MTTTEGRAPLWLRLWSLAIGLFLLAPAVVVIPLGFTDRRSLAFPPTGWSMQWYRSLFGDPAWYRALADSLLIAVLVAVAATALGTLAALGLSRRGLRVRGAVLAVVLSPMVVPIIIFGVGAYALFLRWGLVGTVPGFVLAHTCLAVPYVVITVSASLKTYDRRLSHAAAVLGAPGHVVFRSITMPLIAPGMAAGALFSFITSFDETVIALFISTPRTRTLPVQIFTSITRDVDPTIAAAATVIMAITTGTILLSLLSVGRSREKRP